MDPRAARMAPDFRRAEGVVEPPCQAVTDNRFYLEYLSSDGVDTVYHLFAVPEYTGPWAPPEGNQWIRASLADFRVKAALPYTDDAPWCNALWDTEGVPEYVHFAVRQVDDLVDAWLQSLGIEPARINAVQLLRKMQDLLYRGRSFFAGRLALLERLRQQTLREVLTELEQPLPDGQDVDDKIRAVLDIMAPMKPGVWTIAFRELQDRVMNHKALAEAFLGCLVRAV